MRFMSISPGKGRASPSAIAVELATPPACEPADYLHASSFVTTSPYTSVNRKSRPCDLNVSFV